MNVPYQLESDDERVILLVETDEEEIYQWKILFSISYYYLCYVLP